MSVRAVRCDACRSERPCGYCPHNGVLVVYIDKSPLTIISESEERARITANRLRIKLKGKPFNPPRATSEVIR